MSHRDRPAARTCPTVPLRLTAVAALLLLAACRVRPDAR